MTWNELVEKQANEFKDYLNGGKKRHDQLQEHKAEVLKHMKCTEANLPEAIKGMLAKEQAEWKERWGMYGLEFKTMRVAQQKEVDKFIYREKNLQELKEAHDRKQEKDKGAGR